MRNPYRQILRRHFPEPVLALLIFLMGVWLWDNHLGPTSGYELDTCRMALVKLDRDLRLADSAAGLPLPLRKALDIGDRREVLEHGIAGLSALARHGALDGDGAYALVVLHAVARGENPVDGRFSAVGLSGPPDPRGVTLRFIEGKDAWWDREYLRGIGAADPPEHSARLLSGMEDGRNLELLERAVLSRGAVLLLTLTGLVCLPRTLRAFAAACRSRSRGYIGAWRPGAGLGVFLLAYLASIGFGKLIDLSMSGHSGMIGAVTLPSPLLAALDASTRFLPALVALGFLFRKGRHASSRLGIVAAPRLALVAGGFTLLGLCDILLRRTLGEAMPPDPAGGLSSLEAGRWGLVLAISSACIAAPIAEEILYRGVLFRALANGLNIPAAALFSSAVFALVHFYNLYGLVSVAAVGVTCALCFAASGRLATAIALHALYNAAIKLPEWTVYHAPL